MPNVVYLAAICDVLELRFERATARRGGGAIWGNCVAKNAAVSRLRLESH